MNSIPTSVITQNNEVFKLQQEHNIVLRLIVETERNAIELNNGYQNLMKESEVWPLFIPNSHNVGKDIFFFLLNKVCMMFQNTLFRVQLASDLNKKTEIRGRLLELNE